MRASLMPVQSLYCSPRRYGDEEDRKPSVASLQDAYALHAVPRAMTPPPPESTVNKMLVDVRDSRGNTPVGWAIRAGHQQVLELLVGLGANVTAKNLDNYCPLHLACMLSTDHMHMANMAQTLLRAGVSINELDAAGNTPLMHACMASPPHIIASHRSPLMHACMASPPHIIASHRSPFSKWR